MNKQQAIAAHKVRLARLTNEQARNLMEHAANETPLMPINKMCMSYVDGEGRC